MHRSAVRIESICIAICIKAKYLDLRELSRSQPRGDIGRKIELPLAGPARRKKAGILGIEAFAEFESHLIILLRDAGAYRRDDAFLPGAKLNHPADGRFQHAEMCAPPTGMGCTDHSGIPVRQQDWRAIGGNNGERQSRNIGGHRIHFRALVVRPWRINDDRPRRMDLLYRDKLCAWTGGLQGAAAVFKNSSIVITGAIADLQAGNRTHTDAALTPKKAVRDTFQYRRVNYFDSGA